LCAAEDVAAEVQPTSVPNLDLLPSGPIPASPSELLEKPGLLNLLQWARTQYEYVLIDSPPLIPVADGRTLARLVDGLILVVRVQNDSRELAYRAKNHVVEAGGTVLGVVANGSDHMARYGYYQEGKYGYGEAPQGEETSPEEDFETAGAA
jgi:Mrp family chromosome partitioning ATPase